jgi:cytochrome bd-type quinol oxidase subunit 1
MSRYLPGAILAVCGVLVYGIGCLLFVTQRRQRGRASANKSLFIYAIAMMALGIAALSAGLFALEATQYHAVNG